MPEDLLKASPDGLTAAKVGQRAAATSYTAKAAEEQLHAAGGRVETAWSSFLPQLSGTARYTRLSTLTPPSLGSANLVVTPYNGPPPVPANLLGSVNFSFPTILDNWLLQASVAIPISDYLLRINQNYTFATRAEAAYRYDLATARAKSTSDGKVAYYSWMRARGAVIVAVQSLNDQRTHLNDARNQFSVGNASRADVLRAETAVASADLVLERARNLSDLTEYQLRVAIHASEAERMTPGEPIDTPPPPFGGNVQQMMSEAMSARPEIKSIDANAEATRSQASALRAGQYPVISAFGDAIYANPNPRFIPAKDGFFPTWDAGLQATWNPTEALAANGRANDADGRAAALEAQRQATRDSITVEVIQAFQQVKEQDVALDSTRRELASATEAYRVARDLFTNGRGTSTTLADAETELTRARLDALDAAIDARIARVRLEHALGRDVRLTAP